MFRIFEHKELDPNDNAPKDLEDTFAYQLWPSKDGKKEHENAIIHGSELLRDIIKNSPAQFNPFTSRYHHPRGTCYGREADWLLDYDCDIILGLGFRTPLDY